MRKSFIIVPFLFACTAKGVECADSTQPCVSSQVNDDSHDLSFGDNTYDNDQSNTSTTINNDTTIINNPVITVPPTGGSGGNSGAGGTGGDAYDAGVGGASSNTPDASTVTCDSPSAIPTDVRNWFVTNGPSSNWFQLITADGFSADRCTYTGKVKWFYEGPYGYWESDREYDSPDTIITLRFEQNGDTKVNIVAPSAGYPIGYVYPSNVEYETCMPSCINDTCGGFGGMVCQSSYIDYAQKVCFFPGTGYNCWALRVSVFRGEWQSDRPVVTQQVYPLNAG